MDIAAYPSTWANASMTTSSEAKTENIGKAAVRRRDRRQQSPAFGQTRLRAGTAGDQAGDSDPSPHRASQFSKVQGANSCIRYGFRGLDRKSWGSGTPRRACWPGSASGRARGAPAAPPH
jgi:hypothetical protein